MLISLAATAALRCASAHFASHHGKTRPCSPARAGSTAAFKGQDVGLERIRSMVPIISPIFLELEEIPDIFHHFGGDTAAFSCAASEDGAGHLQVFSAFCLMVDVNCSMLDAVCSRVEACSSVRADNPVLPALICRAALAISPALIATCAIKSCN